jgi:U3 small nucleolar ribonucleoprotein protein LCP5
MAAVESTLPVLLDTLTTSLISATSAFPTEHDSILPPVDGISLLDVKNELLLSYLQNLVFLIILKLRNDPEHASVGVEILKKLNEQRVYLEKGVRPLEGRLKYQIDKVLRAVDEAERSFTAKKSAPGKARNGLAVNGDSGSDASNASDSDASSDPAHNAPAISDISYQPNPTALLRDAQVSSSKSTNHTATGAYKPPRITPTSMPSTTRSDPKSRPRKSHLIDEYIAHDLSSAPQAQPSIGSNNTILDRGRGGMSARDRETEKERTRYEEANLTRLPAMTKKERKKARAGERRDVYGGEDWTGLGGLGERVGRSVKGERGGVLERREKRKRETGDSVRQDGHNLAVGESFEKRRKVLAGRMGKRRGR